jgi:hypothetical protein
MQVVLTKAKLWHFDHPSLYRLEFSIMAGESHCFPTIFGIRKLEATTTAHTWEIAAPEYRESDYWRALHVSRMLF